MSRTAAARRVAVAALAVSLAACSAGQVTQTSDQVAAVDGNSANSANNSVAVRDVTIVLEQNNAAALKFTAVNQDPTNVDHVLKSVSVDGEDAGIDTLTIKPGCSVVAGPASLIDEMKKVNDICITYVEAPLANPGFAAGGNKDVTFTFDTEDITLPATINGVVLEAGTEERNASQDVDAFQHGEKH
ncbi:hypothetical protein C1Y63_05815 [Corynebacterium sp. 13CS0277]|uniref:hypothetical protein n=1 Tax=Corynebacterium sp. 13CS0277 TaxID=2071994 RepID=UPI000D027774|nr:hypothetical protein [Corynebacterium sp. 13CS0277]PRQ11518.1 hypothetical protein C1Y63_05815 [Corynebacterium sp. 13CS0277]